MEAPSPCFRPARAIQTPQAPCRAAREARGAGVRPGERVRAPTKVPRLASSWATRPQSPLLSGQVTSARVGFCAQRLPPGPSESGSHRQVPSPLWESESLRGRTHEATARCPALTSVRFPQPLRSRPEGESGPGPRSPRDPEDRRPYPAAAAERRPSEPAQTCSPDCPRAVGGTAWHGGQGPGWGLAVSRGAGKAKRASSAGLSNPSISTDLGDDWLGGSCTLPSVHRLVGSGNSEAQGKGASGSRPVLPPQPSTCILSGAAAPTSHQPGLHGHPGVPGPAPGAPP